MLDRIINRDLTDLRLGIYIKQILVGSIGMPLQPVMPSNIFPNATLSHSKVPNTVHVQHGDLLDTHFHEPIACILHTHEAYSLRP
jgi:hypothetical protein